MQDRNAFHTRRLGVTLQHSEVDTQSVSSTASFVSSTASSVADNLICKKSWCLKIIIKETGGRSGIGAAEVIVNSPDNSRIFGHH